MLESLDLDLRGKTHWRDGRVVGADATLLALELAANAHVWKLRSPCHGSIEASLATLEKCVLFEGKQELTLGARVPLADPDATLDATFATRALDLRALGAFFAPGHKELPHSAFEMRVHASGTRRAPLFDLELEGLGSQIDEGLPENVSYRIRAHHGLGRVTGEISARQLGTRLGIGARFDLPTSFDGKEDRPLSFELEARPVPFFKLRDRLPTELAGLRGFFNLRARAGGTTRHPTFTAELHAPSWNLDDLTNNDTVVNLSYDGQTLHANSVTSFAATTFANALFRIHPRRNSGTVQLELQMAIDVAQLLARPREALATLQHSAQLTASAQIKGVELQRVPLQIVGIASPFTTGLVDGALQLTGTMDDPVLHVSLRGAGLEKPGVVDHLGLSIEGALVGGRAQLSGELSLHDHLALRYKGEARLDVRQLLAGGPWRNGAARLDVDVPSFDLRGVRDMQHRWRQLEGSLSGKAYIRGTFAAPVWKGELSVRSLALGGDPFVSVSASARYGEGHFTGHGRADQLHGGAVEVSAAWSRLVDEPLALALVAHRLDLGFLSSAWDEVNQLGGTLEAQARVSGTRARPKIDEGEALIERASLTFHGPAQQLREVRLELHTSEGRLRGQLDANGGEGAMHVVGTATLDGMKPAGLTLSVQAARLRLPYGARGTTLDADFTLEGARGADGWSGRVDLLRGKLALGELIDPARKEDQPMLVDVRYSDQREATGSPGSRGMSRHLSDRLHVTDVAGTVPGTALAWSYRR